MAVENGPYPAWCQEKVRCIASDEYMAMSRITDWGLSTQYIWWTEADELVQHLVPFGPRSVTIVKVEKYADNVGELLKLCPLPNIFPHED